jgi:hypothetical protein
MGGSFLYVAMSFTTKYILRISNIRVKAIRHFFGFFLWQLPTALPGKGLGGGDFPEKSGK